MFELQFSQRLTKLRHKNPEKEVNCEVNTETRKKQLLIIKQIRNAEMCVSSNFRGQ